MVKKEEVLNAISSIYNVKEESILKKHKRANRISFFITIILIALLAFIMGHYVFFHDVEGLHTVCYTTLSGKCYHSGTCRYLYNSSHKTTVFWARLKGKRSCSKCSVGPVDIEKVDGIAAGLTVSVIVNGIIYFFVRRKINTHYLKQLETCRSINRRKEQMKKNNIHYDENTAIKIIKEYTQQLK